jgi:hypothetical protein
LGKGPPRWRLSSDRNNPVFQAARDVEVLKAKRFTGLRPANSHPNQKGSCMSLPVQILLERLTHLDDGVIGFSIAIDLLGVNAKNITATIESDAQFEQPRLISVVDQIGFLELDQHSLLLAAFKKMAGYHGSGPTGGTIQWARWVTPNIRKWLRDSMYQQTATRIARTMRSHFAVEVPPTVKEFTESVEG